MRFMGHLTSRAPEAELEPWIAQWQPLQPSSMLRTLMVDVLPGGATWTPCSVFVRSAVMPWRTLRPPERAAEPDPANIPLRQFETPIRGRRLG